MSTQAIQKASPVATLATFLDGKKQQLAAVLPNGQSVTRYVPVLLAAVARTPRLAECTPLSLYNALHQAAQLGLELCGPLGHAYAVPFRKKDGTTEAQMIIGYKGLCNLARRGGEVEFVEAHLVYGADTFSYERGLTPSLKHVPANFGDRGGVENVIGGYAVAWLKDNSERPIFELMSKDEIEAVRHRSKSANDGPWVTDWGQMARKTIIKRLANYLPLSVDAAQAIADENERERIVDTTATVTVEAPAAPAPKKGKATAAPAVETFAEPEPPPVPEATLPHDPVTGEVPSDAAEPSAMFLALQNEINAAPGDRAATNRLSAKVSAALTDGKITGSEKAALAALIAGKAP